MAINLVSPSTFTTAVLIGDTVTSGGAQQTIPSLTKVGGVAVSAALEIQSTTGTLLLPRLTQAQITALQTPTQTTVDGMMVYNSTSSSFNLFAGGSVLPVGGASIQYATGTLTLANLQGMFGAAVTLIAAPGAGKQIVVHGFGLNAIFGSAAFTNGGAIYLIYGTTGAATTFATSSTAIPATFLTTFAANQSDFSAGPSVAAITSANAVNKAVSITNATAAFAVGTGATASWFVWYSIIPAA